MLAIGSSRRLASRGLSRQVSRPPQFTPATPRAVPATEPSQPALPAELSRGQLLELYRYLRLTRILEERLTALYRQSKVIGGLFRSLGQEGESVASAYALERGRHRDLLSPLIPNPGSIPVMGAGPPLILRPYLATAPV